jgi:two-component system sensor kinase FixL
MKIARSRFVETNDVAAIRAERTRRPFSRPSASSRSGDSSIVAVTVIAVLLLALSGWLARADLEQARATDRLGDHARSVQIGADRLLSTLTDAETGQRGYLLTGNRSYLQPYEAARARLSPAFTDLRALPRMGGEGARRLDVLQGLATAKMAELAQTVALAKAGNLPAAIAVVRSDRGKRIMDAIRVQLAAISASAEADLRRERLHARPVWLPLAIIGLGVLSSLLLAAVAIGQREARRTVDASLASLERFKRAFDLSHGMLRGMDGKIIFWAAGMERLYGFTAQEAVGRASHDLLDTEFPIPLPRIIEILARDGQWHGELTHRHRDGSMIEVASHWALQRAADGQASAIVEVNNDISDARRAQRESEATSELLAAIVASSDDAILSKTIDGLVTSWNAGAEHLFGYTAGEAVGQHIRFIIPPERLAEEAAIIAAIVAGELIEHYETVRVAKDGRRLEISASISPIHDKQGRIVGAANVARDIAARKAADSALADSQRTLEGIVESAMDALITLDPHDCIIKFNPAAERMFGVARADVIGATIERFIPERFREGHSEHIRHFKDAGVTNRSMGALGAISGLRANGEEFPLEASISHVDVGGATIATVILRDITARKRLEAERAQHVQALERSNSELDDFAYIASHDLKEPLRGLFNNSKFLHEDYADKLDADGVKRLLRLGYLSQRMEQLVNDLLYFSRLGRQALATQWTDLNAVIRDIEMMSETLLLERDARIVVPHPLPQTLCDKTRIAEVFRNLVVNAVKYNESPSKRIEVGFLEERETAAGLERQVFYVKDNGIGIAEEFHDDIFRIFKRLNAEDDDKKGSGVGLTFVRKIIERHGGRIWVESALGAGTAFYFTIGQGQAYAAAA